MAESSYGCGASLLSRDRAPSRLRPTEGKLATIAGQSGGKQVYCSPQALPVVNQLVALANKGKYWAGLIVRGIKGLTSGRLHMDNVYVQKESKLAYGIDNVSNAPVSLARRQKMPSRKIAATGGTR
jgi:hypothetical protein